MVVWLRPEYILAFVTSLYCCSQTVLAKTYDKFWCATEEGHHQISCSDDRALLTDVSIRKVYRRTQMCAPDDHSEYLVHCQAFIDASACEGNKTCTIDISSRDYLQCGEKTYAPTYFFVKYTCIQIHTMCTETAPIRNTLYGYIISPAHPHPMADNLTCSITIEADPSMYIELAPLQIRLQEAIKCRTEFIEILGYDSAFDETNQDKNLNWKAYYTWCGADQSLNNPSPTTRYLITSNSLYISLRTGMSKKPRHFKIRYKIVPVTARSQYNDDGLAIDSSGKGPASSAVAAQSSTAIVPTTIIVPALNETEFRYGNETVAKRFFRKEVIIGIAAGVIAVLCVAAAGVIIFLVIKRRRAGGASSTSAKKSAPAASSTAASKPAGKSSDKAPLLEQKPIAAASGAKQKLVPERTVQIAETTTRFKSNDAPESKPAASKPDATPVRATLTAADSGIYGADLSEDSKIPLKPGPVQTPATTSAPAPAPIPPKPATDEPAAATVIVDLDPTPTEPAAPKTETEPAIANDVEPTPEPVPTVVVNPLSENTTISAIVVPNHVELNPLPANGTVPVMDNTIQSAYSHLIDATTSENEGPACSSALQSRRTSNLRHSAMLAEAPNTDTVVVSEYADGSSHSTIPFNPLHVILKKDANKYYTTEYI